MRSVSDKSHTENQDTNFICSISFRRKFCRRCDNAEKYGTARKTTDDELTRRMRFACYTLVPSEYVILTPFPRQQGLRKRAQLPDTYIAYLVKNCLRLKLQHGAAVYSSEENDD